MIMQCTLIVTLFLLGRGGLNASSHRSLIFFGWIAVLMAVVALNALVALIAVGKDLRLLGWSAVFMAVVALDDVFWPRAQALAAKHAQPQAHVRHESQIAEPAYDDQAYELRLDRGPTPQDVAGYIYIKIEKKFAGRHAGANRVKIGRAVQLERRWIPGLVTVYSTPMVENHKALESCIRQLLRSSHVDEPIGVPVDGKTEWHNISVQEAKDAISYARRNAFGMFRERGMSAGLRPADMLRPRTSVLTLVRCGLCDAHTVSLQVPPQAAQRARL